MLLIKTLSFFPEKVQNSINKNELIDRSISDTCARQFETGVEEIMLRSLPIFKWKDTAQQHLQSKHLTGK